MLDERRRVGTVAAAHPVLRREAGPLRIGNERVRQQRPLVDLAVAAAHRARGNSAPHRAREWVVTAGVENDEAQDLYWLQDLVHSIERYGLILHIDVPFEHGVGR